MARFAEFTEDVLHAVFHALHRHRVVLEHMLLKPSMVVPGKAHAKQASPDEVGRETLKVLKRAVPASVPGIFFLSGGQTPAEATANLDAMNRLGPLPWLLSFSYGRALQDPAMQAWRGNAGQGQATQQALLKRARLNGAAQRGKYEAAMEA
jgi:fructose-bisphosphate aldolase class I